MNKDLKCPKCGRNQISVTNDGQFGVRAHCLFCGETWTPKNPEKKD